MRNQWLTGKTMAIVAMIAIVVALVVRLVWIEQDQPPIVVQAVQIEPPDANQDTASRSNVDGIIAKLDKDQQGITATPFRDRTAASKPGKRSYHPSNAQETSTVVAVGRVLELSYAELLKRIDSSATYGLIEATYGRHAAAINDLRSLQSKAAAEFAKSMSQQGLGEVWIVPHDSSANSQEAKAKIEAFRKAREARTQGEFVACQQFGIAPEGHHRSVLFRIAPGQSAELDAATTMLKQAREAAAAEIWPLLN